MPKSIVEQIKCLARLTGAPRSFVTQVCRLFERKGISLEADAAPYLHALEEAFTREEDIRATALRTRRNLARLTTDFKAFGAAQISRFERPGRAGSSLERQALELEIDRTMFSDGDPFANSVVTRPQRDDVPLVPGPDDLQ